MSKYNQSIDYTLCVDGKYFVKETNIPCEGHSIAPSGFFQMVGDNTMCAYEFSENPKDAAKMILFNIIGYLTGVYERTRYLSADKRPHKIEITEVR